MSDRKTIRVMMVDDQEIFRMGVRMLIDSTANMTMVGECSRLSDAAEMTKDSEPDLVLLALRFEDGHGLDLIPTLADAAKVVVLTAETDSEVHEKCLKSGANGLLSKEATARELLEVVVKVHNGEMWFDKGLMSKVVRDLTRPHGGGPADDELQRIQTLSPREREVIVLLGEGLKNQHIAERLFISDATVRHHMTSILSKLDVSTRLELVVFAFKHGLARIPSREKR